MSRNLYFLVPFLFSINCTGIKPIDYTYLLVENNSNYSVGVDLHNNDFVSKIDLSIGEDTTLRFIGPAGLILAELDSAIVFFDTLKVSKYYRENLPSDSLNRSLLNRDSYIIEEGDRQKGAKSWHLTYTVTPADFIRADTIE